VQIEQQHNIGTLRDYTASNTSLI